MKESNRGRQLRRELESGDIGHYEKWWSRTKRWDGMLGVCKYGADSLNRNEIALQSYKVTFSHLVSLSLATICGTFVPRLSWFLCDGTISVRNGTRLGKLLSRFYNGCRDVTKLLLRKNWG